MAKLAFLVNPIAGMGGTVGLKGTDSNDILKEARRRGALPVAPVRAREFLGEFWKQRKDESTELLTVDGPMGGDNANGLGIPYRSIGKTGERTASEDTVQFSRRARDAGARFIVFVGGDGTANDVVKGVGETIPVLGVPSGVKIYSSVFAVNPKAAADTTARFLNEELSIVQREVLDVDEDEYRNGHLNVRLAGYLSTPDADLLMQNPKMPTLGSENEEIDEVASYVTGQIKQDTVYILGPGSTIERISQKLGIEKTLLGVDVVKGDGTVLARDVSESDILRLIGKNPTWIIVSPIGGQGFLFGRGNQQVSPDVLRIVGIENVIIVATRSKMWSLRPRRLLVDTGDEDLDARLRGYRRVIVGYEEEMLVKIE